MKINRRKLGTLIGTALLLIATVGAAAVFAQETDEGADNTTKGAEASESIPRFRGRGCDLLGRSGQARGLEYLGPIAGLRTRGIDRDQLLAEALDITLDELHQAQQEVRKAAVLQAVEEGIISQNEADHILAFMALKVSLDHQALMAESLGISVDELIQTREDGIGMRDLLEELNMTPTDVRAGLREAFVQAVEGAVQSGAITEEQGELVLNLERPDRFFPGLLPRGRWMQRDRGF